MDPPTSHTIFLKTSDGTLHAFICFYTIDYQQPVKHFISRDGGINWVEYATITPSLGEYPKYSVAKDSSDNLYLVYPAHVLKGTVTKGAPWTWTWGAPITIDIGSGCCIINVDSSNFIHIFGNGSWIKSLDGGLTYSKTVVSIGSNLSVSLYGNDIFIFSTDGGPIVNKVIKIHQNTPTSWTVFPSITLPISALDLNGMERRGNEFLVPYHDFNDNHLKLARSTDPYSINWSVKDLLSTLLVGSNDRQILMFYPDFSHFRIYYANWTSYGTCYQETRDNGLNFDGEAYFDLYKTGYPVAYHGVFASSRGGQNFLVQQTDITGNVFFVNNDRGSYVLADQASAGAVITDGAIRTSDGTIHAVANRANQAFYYFSRDKGLTWNEILLEEGSGAGASSGSSAIAKDKYDNLIFTYSRGPLYSSKLIFRKALVTKAIPWTWTLQTPVILGNCNDLWNASIILVDIYNYYHVFISGTQMEPCYWWRSLDDGASWIKETAFSFVSGSYYHWVSAVVDCQNNIWAFISERDSGHNKDRIRARKITFTAPSTWSLGTEKLVAEWFTTLGIGCPSLTLNQLPNGKFTFFICFETGPSHFFKSVYPHSIDSWVDLAFDSVTNISLMALSSLRLRAYWRISNKTIYRASWDSGVTWDPKVEVVEGSGIGTVLSSRDRRYKELLWGPA